MRIDPDLNKFQHPLLFQELRVQQGSSAVRRFSSRGVSSSCRSCRLGCPLRRVHDRVATDAAPVVLSASTSAGGGVRRVAARFVLVLPQPPHSAASSVTAAEPNRGRYCLVRLFPLQFSHTRPGRSLYRSFGLVDIHWLICLGKKSRVEEVSKGGVLRVTVGIGVIFCTLRGGPVLSCCFGCVRD